MNREEFLKKIESLSEEDKEVCIDWFDRCKGRKVQEISSNGTIAEILRNSKRFVGRVSYEYSKSNNIVSAKPIDIKYDSIEACDEAIAMYTEMIKTIEARKKEIIQEFVSKYKDDIQALMTSNQQ